MIVDQRLCRLRQRTASGALLRDGFFYMVPPAAVSGPLLPTVQRAAERHAQGAAQEAERLCLPKCWSWRRVSSMLGLVLIVPDPQGGRVWRQPPILSCSRIVRVHPNTLWATHELTLALFGKGAIAEAEIHARNAVRIAPQNPQSHNLMGMIFMTEANRPPDRRIPLPQGHRTGPVARPDPPRQSRLEPGGTKGGWRKSRPRLYEESSTQAPEILQTCSSAGRASRRVPTALSSAPRNYSIAPTEVGAQ